MDNYLSEFEVDPSTEYDCCNDTKSIGFTPLMRMVTRADIPNILEIITDHLKKKSISN